MLRPWRDHVDILLTPRRLRLTRTQRAVRARLRGEAQCHVDNANLSDWRPACAVLQAELQQPAWQDADAHVVLSDHWTRYTIVPWSDDIANEEERIAQGRISFIDLYGKVAEQWQVHLSDGGPGAPRVAAAIPGALLDELRTIMARARLRVVSVQPQLVAAHNHWRRRLGDAQGWFVTVDEGTLAAVRLLRRGWDRVYTARIGSDWTVELQRLHTLARLLAPDDADCRLYVDAPVWLRERTGRCGVGIEWLVEPDRAGGLGLVGVHGHRLA